MSYNGEMRKEKGDRKEIGFRRENGLGLCVWGDKKEMGGLPVFDYVIYFLY